ncbi:MAG: sulfite exporter TauE/SafE family protein [Candidatus Aminicenantales bacterium]
MPEFFWLLVPVLFIISLVYTSVGLGGGSSYIAVFYLFGLPLGEIPPLALFLNIIAASTALYRFGRKGYVASGFVIPLLVSSVPAAYFGARYRLDEKLLSLIFAVVLLSVAFVLFFRKKEVKTRFSLGKKGSWIILLFLGALLGSLAGIMGIGGGILLGPILLLLGLSSARYVAGICSAFVLVNSIIGLTSHYLQGRVEFSVFIILGLAVFVGAQVGSLLGTRKFSSLLLQRILASLLLIVSLKLGIGAL